MDALDEIVATKHKATRAILIALRPALQPLFAEYPKLAITPLQWTNDQKAAMLLCYSSNAAPLVKMKKELIDRQVALLRNVCAYCEDGSASTFDHYVPQERYPEYAACHLNLVRACSICNGLKADLWEVGQPPVLHAYLESLPLDCRWLSATVEVVGNEVAATFFVDFVDAIDAEWEWRIREHVRVLELLRRFREQFAELVNETIAWTVSRASPPADELRGAAAEYARSRGKNYWKAVALEAMSDSAEYAEWLERNTPQLRS